MKSGLQYDPDTNVISVPNSTALANVHRDVVAAGWKKAAPGARANPMPSGKSGSAQQVGDVPYQLGEEDELARMMEMAGVKTEGKKPDFLDVDKDGNKAEPFKKAVDDKKEKKVDEGILASTANLWKEYKGQYGV
jgi:hypothetical protein